MQAEDDEETRQADKRRKVEVSWGEEWKKGMGRWMCLTILLKSCLCTYAEATFSQPFAIIPGVREGAAGSRAADAGS